MLLPQAMQLASAGLAPAIAPISSGRCGPSPGCVGQVDRLGEPKLWSTRGVAHEPVGPEGQVVPRPPGWHQGTGGV